MLVAHRDSDELYLVTEGQHGGTRWRATPIGMADVYSGMVYRGLGPFYRVTNPRTIEAWAERMAAIGRPECESILRSILNRSY